MNLIFFTLVPLSQVLLYLASSAILKKPAELVMVRESLNMSTTQFTTFQVISTILFSLISFIFMYFVYKILIKLFSSNYNSDALFMSLVLAVVFSNGLGIIMAISFKTIIPQLTAVIQTLVLVVLYFILSKENDKSDNIGTIVLGVVAVVFNIIPSFFL